MGRKRTPADGAYKAFFSDKDMVTSLMQDFVPESFVKDMDFSTLEPFPTDRVTRGFCQRYDDTIWRLNWQNSPCYLFLMLEFQSTINPFMPVRVLVYSALLWQYLINQGSIKPGDKLPPVFPIVLYNGKKKWKAPSNVKSLLIPMPKGLMAYQPSQKFFLIDENALSSKIIDAAKGVSANLFGLERLKSGDLMAKLLCDVNADLQKYPDSLRQTFDNWIFLFLKERKIIKSEADYLKIKGDQTMFGETLKNWEDSLLLKGEANVIGDMKRSLLKALEERFMPISSAIKKKLNRVNENSSLFDLISSVYKVKDLSEFDALLDSKLPSHK
ncbi:MAG: Rpn family recombination-promoting nuclease/putative transposase [Desulfovibrio sp.]|nr:Rpn family recombination-promoting nuclease/putative transposase [Desulfovibrio sp.]